ncbi:EamA family transporter RarD [Tabrizicola sp. J26]|uniref:EamA family transporter RarD n=1 Tax=Alitabrizicola rongguiensis TaxID=2909234 RepID=UPI001F3926B3|nr:EamA family transporter RarD [Tabrizicola rongguiensis]MCF1709627.1 EamA family transporter RarD [Tabrizicola rongguiensis]
MSEGTKGVLAMLAAAVIWGLSPLYYKALAQVPPLEVLSHRTIWSAVFFAVVLLVKGRLSEVGSLIRSHDVWVVALAALMISTNWFLFILSVQIGMATEASLGYYMFPIVAVVIGVVFFGEKLSALQAVAAVVAGIAVALLTWGLHVPPWIALTLAITFGIYGLVKKRLKADPIASVTAEVTLLAPLALIWIAGVQAGWFSEGGRPGGHFMGHNPGDGWETTLLLLGSGVITGGPLILFAAATHKASMATVGLVQFVNPTLQFLCAVVVFGEPFTIWHKAAFALIWVAVAIYSLASFRQESASRSRSASVATSGTSEE